MGKNLSLSPKAPKESSRSRLSGLSPMKSRKKKDMASSEDAAALAGEESAPPEQTITVKMMRTPLGLGLTVDSQNKVVKISRLAGPAKRRLRCGAASDLAQRPGAEHRR